MAYSNIRYLRIVANDDEAPNRIRELREAAGLKQDRLADIVGMHQSTLSKLEKGSRGLGFDDMRRIANALNVAPVDLMPHSDHGMVLTDAERELIMRLRQSDDRERETFDRVAAAILPDLDKGSAEVA